MTTDNFKNKHAPTERRNRLPDNRKWRWMAEEDIRQNKLGTSRTERKKAKKS